MRVACRCLALAGAAQMLAAAAAWPQDPREQRPVYAPRLAVRQIGAFGGTDATLGIHGQYPFAEVWGAFVQVSRTAVGSPPTWRFDAGVNHRGEHFEPAVFYVGYGSRVRRGAESQEGWSIGLLLELGVEVVFSRRIRGFGEYGFGIFTSGPELLALGGVALAFPFREGARGMGRGSETRHPYASVEAPPRPTPRKRDSRRPETTGAGTSSCSRSTVPVPPTSVRWRSGSPRWEGAECG